MRHGSTLLPAGAARAALLGLLACWFAAPALHAQPAPTAAPAPAHAASPGNADAPPADEPPQDLTHDAWEFLQKLHLGEQLLALWRKHTWREWAWLGAALALGVLVGRAARFVIGFVAARWRARGWLARAELLASAAWPLNLACVAVGASLGLGALELPPGALAFSRAIVNTLLLTALFGWGYGMLGALDLALGKFTTRPEAKLGGQLIPLVRKSGRVLLVVAALLTICQVVFGADVGAALAGLGLAGLAVSLAAQDTIKQLFGSATILFDQPFLVGERVVALGVDGVVEEIGLRSTKVRAFDGQLVTIPNSSLAGAVIENVSRRPFIRRVLNLGLVYDTPPEKLELAVRLTRDILDSEGFRERVRFRVGADEYAPRVYFDDYRADNLNLRVMYWFAPPVYWDYLEFAQRFNLEVARRFAAAGIEFAFPTQTLHVVAEEPAGPRAIVPRRAEGRG